MRRILRTLLILSLFLISACFAHSPDTKGCQGCEPAPIVKPEQAFVKILGFVGDKVLTSGSGVVIANDEVGSYILTAAHVCMFIEGYGLPDVPGISKETILSLLSMHGMYHNGEFTPLVIVEYEEETDLCIMQALKSHPHVLPIAETTPEVGKTYMAYTSPNGMAGKGLSLIYDGYLSGDIKVPTSDLAFNLYTIASSPGSSGSPIVDENNEIVGVISRYLKDGTPVSISPKHKDLRTFVRRALCKERLEQFCSETRD